MVYLCSVVLRNTHSKYTNKYKQDMDKRIMTPFQRDRLARDKNVYRDYKALMSERGARNIGVYDFLCKKYGLHSRNTIHVIRRRMEAMESEGLI